MPGVHSKTSSAFGYIKDIWQETFPQEDELARSKMQRRKQIAKLQKELENNQLTPEEVEKLQASIPDWKKGAVVITDEKPTEERSGLFRRLGRKVKSSVNKTSAAQEFYQSD